MVLFVLRGASSRQLVSFGTEVCVASISSVAVHLGFVCGDGMKTSDYVCCICRLRRTGEHTTLWHLLATPHAQGNYHTFFSRLTLIVPSQAVQVNQSPLASFRPRNRLLWTRHVADAWPAPSSSTSDTRPLQSQQSNLFELQTASKHLISVLLVYLT